MRINPDRDFLLLIRTPKHESQLVVEGVEEQVKIGVRPPHDACPVRPK